MDPEDINDLASLFLVVILAAGNEDPLSTPETVRRAFGYADEFARQTKERASNEFNKAHGG